MRRQWLDARDTIGQAYNERIEKCQSAQDDLRFAFDAANEIQAQQNRAHYAKLIETQDRTRDSANRRGSNSRERSTSARGMGSWFTSMILCRSRTNAAPRELVGIDDVIREADAKSRRISWYKCS
jgi:hypothetical protein